MGAIYLPTIEKYSSSSSCSMEQEEEEGKKGLVMKSCTYTLHAELYVYRSHASIYRKRKEGEAMFNSYRPYSYIPSWYKSYDIVPTTIVASTFWSPLTETVRAVRRYWATFRREERVKKREQYHRHLYLQHTETYLRFIYPLHWLITEQLHLIYSP